MHFIGVVRFWTIAERHGNCFLQAEASPGWAEGLPMDVLALVAGGRDDLKAMRGVCSNWKQGFERSISDLRIKRAGPVFPPDGSFSERFSGLTRLNLGSSLIDEADLSQLVGLSKLKTLILGDYFSWEEGQHQGRLSNCLTSAGFQHLGSLPKLQTLLLGGCGNLVDEALEGLRGAQLKDLSLGKCCGLRGYGFQYLEDLPIARLDLHHCDKLETLEGLRKLPLTVLNLGRCTSLSSLEALQGLPLARLTLDGCNLKDPELLHLQGSPITCLSLCHCSHITGVGLESLLGLPIASLNLVGGALLRGDDLQFLRGLPLTSLQLGRFRNFSGEGLRYLAEIPLHKLELEGCYQLKAETLRYLRGIPLTELKFFATDLGDAGMPYIRCLSSSLKSLSFVNMRASSITDMGLEHLRGMQLTSLTLSQFEHLSDSGLGSLRGMPLTNLTISCQHLTDACLDVFLSFRELIYLYLSGCNGVSKATTDCLARSGVYVVRYAR